MTRRPGPRELRGGTWNAERGRDPHHVAASAWAIMRRHNLHFLALQETSKYLPALAALSGCRLIAAEHPTGKRETCILVADVQVDHIAFPRMTRDGWYTVRGGHTPDKFQATATLDGWLTVGSQHWAPSVNWPDGRILPRGPVHRVASIRDSANHTVSYARHHDGPLVIAADWNATPADRGRWTPHWTAQRAQMKLYVPHEGTHGPEDIDYLMGRGVHVSDIDAHGTSGSDHHYVTFTVTER